MHRRVDPAGLVDSVLVRRVGVVPPGLELDERQLVRHVAVDLVRREESERRLRARAACRLEQVQRADRIHIEVVEGPRRRKVVRGLCRRVDDEVRLELVYEPQHRPAVADVHVVMLEAASVAAKALQVPRRVPVLAEEIAAHVVVDSVDRPAALVEERNGFGADQTA